MLLFLGTFFTLRIIIIIPRPQRFSIFPPLSFAGLSFPGTKMLPFPSTGKNSQTSKNYTCENVLYCETKNSWRKILLTIFMCKGIKHFQKHRTMPFRNIWISSGNCVLMKITSNPLLQSLWRPETFRNTIMVPSRNFNGRHKTSVVTLPMTYQKFLTGQIDSAGNFQEFQKAPFTIFPLVW